MKIPVSGVATVTPDSTSSQNLLGKNITSGRVFWLRRAWFYKATQPADAISIYDATNSTTGAPAASALRYKVLSDYTVQVQEVEFPGYGLKFETGCVISVDGTATGYTLAGGIGDEE